MIRLQNPGRVDRVGDDGGISVGEPNGHDHVGVEPRWHVERLRMRPHQPFPVGERGSDDDRVLVELPGDNSSAQGPSRPSTRGRLAYAVQRQRDASDVGDVHDVDRKVWRR